MIGCMNEQLSKNAHIFTLPDIDETNVRIRRGALPDDINVPGSMFVGPHLLFRSGRSDQYYTPVRDLAIKEHMNEVTF